MAAEQYLSEKIFQADAALLHCPWAGKQTHTFTINRIITLLEIYFSDLWIARMVLQKSTHHVDMVV